MELYSLVNDSYILNYAILEIYIPLDMKDLLIDEKGDSCGIYGSYYFRAFKTEAEWEKRKNSDFFYNTLIASYFETIPSERDITTIEVNGRAPREHAVFRYFKGDRVVSNYNLIKDLDNDTLTMKMFLAGKLEFLDYDDMIKSIHRETAINGVNHRVSSYMYGMMASTIYRDPKNDQPARMMKQPKIVVGYNPRELTSKASTHSAITFEEPNTMIIVADNKTRKGIKEPDSDLEKILKGDISVLE